MWNGHLSQRELAPQEGSHVHHIIIITIPNTSQLKRQVRRPRLSPTLSSSSILFPNQN
jgi:hypothetical protein